MKKITSGYLTYFLCSAVITLNGMEESKFPFLFVDKQNGGVFDVTNVVKKVYNAQESATFNELAVLAFLINKKTGSLYKSKEINISDIENNTPLSYAVEYENYAMVQYLIEQKANPNFCSDYKKAPLYIAIQKNYKAIVQLLVQNGADRKSFPESHNQQKGSTPLTIASSNNRLDWVKEILEKQPKV
jgi:ankyrin repeat protein